MPKPLFQDIVPPERRSIKKIPLPERENEIEPEPERVHTPKKHRTKSGRKHSFLWVLILLVIIGGGMYFFISQVPGATIILTPKTKNVFVDTKFTATSDVNGELPYQAVLYQKDGKLVVPATGEETVQIKASGVIRIFNDFSASPQKLVANTRFETAGKIFRIKDSITIPGINNGMPGSIDVLVVADGVGESYNVGLVDFTIPGFAGDARYKKIFARSLESVKGGFSGTRKKVDSVVLTDAKNKIHSELETNFIKQIKQNIPPTFVFPNNAYFISYESLPNATSTDGVVIVERATFHGIIFKRENLAEILTNKISDLNVGSSTFLGMDNLSFLLRGTSTVKPWQSTSFDFFLKGTTTLVSDIDATDFKNNLVGKSRKDFNLVLQGYSSIEKAEVIMHPFWNKDFPNNTKDLSVNVVEATTSPK